MAVGIEDGLSRVTDGQVLAVGLTVSVILGTAIDGEVGSLMDNRPGPGIRTGVGGVPEAVAEVDGPECIGV